MFVLGQNPDRTFRDGPREMSALDVITPMVDENIGIGSGYIDGKIGSSTNHHLQENSLVDKCL